MFNEVLLMIQTNQPEGIENSTIFYIMTSIILPVLMWLITPKDFKKNVMRFFIRNKIDQNQLSENIKKLHLGIANEKQLNVEEFVKKYRYVFFPVVPNKTPNVIHITFINAIKGLEKLGLHVYVFVFDDYFCKVKGYGANEKKTYITNFVKTLQHIGIDKGQILFESDFLKKKRKSKKLISTIYSITSKLNITEVNELSIVNGHYLDSNSKYIRKLKSILNMIYPTCISDKIGFVLSGKDECKLWEIYQNKIDQKIIHLYIDSLYTIDGDLSNVLDSNILSCQDSIDDIKGKITILLNNISTYNKNCSMFYLLEHNYFIYDKKISFGKQNGKSVEISSTEALIDYCSEQLNSGKVNEETIDTLANITYKIFHPQKGV